MKFSVSDETARMEYTSFFAVCFFLVTPGLIAAITTSNGTVYYNDGVYTMKLGVIDKNGGVAYGTYDDSLETNGWGVLDIVAGMGGTKVKDSVVMYAAGYLEGALTAQRLYEHYVNMHDSIFTAKPQYLEPKMRAWLEKQESWMRQMINAEETNSSFWRQMGNIIAQFDGLADGYNKFPFQGKGLDRFAFQMLNGVGDLIDLLHVLAPELRPDWSRMTKDEVIAQVGRMGHCSALIKVLPAYEDIFAAHSSWFTYGAMVRIYKHYYFNLADKSTATRGMSFSSYPGFLESLDDFYILDSGLIMLQTTNNVFNTSLYDQVIPQTLLAWQRVRLAHLMAHSGKEWADIVKQYNSGTYNNQYMVLDLKLVELNRSLRDGALWVVEQIPTLVVSGDQTPILRAGYWPSYNVPFYEKIYNLSGYPQFVSSHGMSFSYELAPRAKIFRRDQGKVVDLETMKHIMRYNDYEHDPYSFKSPFNAICARGDLSTENPSPGGCYDTKVTDFTMAAHHRSAVAVNGPTAQGLPPFRWSKYSFKQKHLGQPDLFDFDFVLMKPKF